LSLERESAEALRMLGLQTLQEGRGRHSFATVRHDSMQRILIHSSGSLMQRIERAEENKVISVVETVTLPPFLLSGIESHHEAGVAEAWVANEDS
jgi:hypothetical protein